MIKLRKRRSAGQVACMVEMIDVYNIFVGKPEKKRHLEEPRRKCQDNIKLDIRDKRT
jgi:hypothetical protein